MGKKTKGNALFAAWRGRTRGVNPILDFSLLTLVEVRLWGKFPVLKSKFGQRSPRIYETVVVDWEGQHRPLPHPASRQLDEGDPRFLHDDGDDNTAVLAVLVE